MHRVNQCIRLWLFCLLCVGVFSVSVQAETVLLQERNGTETETGEEEQKQRKTESKSRIEQEEILEESQVDIDALAKELKKLEGEYPCPDFSRIFSYLFSFRFKEAGKEAGEWLLHALTFEFSSSRVLVGQLIGVVLFAAVFSNLSSAFRRFSIGDSGFLISYFISFTIIFANFNLMADLFRNTVTLLSRVLKLLIPVYTLAVTLTGNLTVGIVFYEYFMIVVLVVNWLCLMVVLPMIQYYLLLELLNHFSARQNISRLCESLYLFLERGIKFLFFLFFGVHLLDTMVVPSFDWSKNVLLNRMIGWIPGAGSLVQTVTGTLLGSSLLIKNTMGAASILFLILILAIPVLKILLYCFFYLLLSILLEPVADERFIRCITAAQKSGMLLVYALCMTVSLFILTIAVTALATNKLS